MKQAPQFLRLGIAVLVAGLVLGLMAFFLVPVAFPGAAPESAAEPQAPPALAAADPTALPHLDPAAPAPNPAVLKTVLDAALSSGGDGTTVTATVIDVAGGEELYSRSGGQPGVPASSLKVLTAIAATQDIGENHRFTTKTVLKDPNTVVLVGGGDVLLGTGAGSASASGRAGLGTLAQRTATALRKARAAGQAAQAVRIELDESLFAGATLNPGWDASLVSTHNISPISPIAMYGARATGDAKSARVADPGLHAATLFAKELRAAVAADGMQVAAEVVRSEGRTPGTELASVASATVGEQVRFMLEVSDNYVAEVLGRLVAVAQEQPGDYSHAAAAVAQTIAGLGIDTTGMHLVDTSGLAGATRVTPLTLARALAYAATSEHAALRNLSYRLPVAGATGTLAPRLVAADTRGVGRAKTGSLMEVSSLSGLTVTRDGRVLAFSIFVHTNDRTIAPHKGLLDAAATALTGCGCR